MIRAALCCIMLMAGLAACTNPAFKDGTTKKDGHYSYMANMAKNTYWFSCWGEL